jgi:hypothetical protein
VWRMIGRKTRRRGCENVGGSRELEDDGRVMHGSPTGLNTTALPHSFSSSSNPGVQHTHHRVSAPRVLEYEFDARKAVRGH